MDGIIILPSAVGKGEAVVAVQSDFSKGSIPMAITRLAVPMTAAQLVNILYNIVDRMYIGRIPGEGRVALTGLGLVLPIISIVIGFANLCGTGGAPLCSICRGKGEDREAEGIMGNAFTLLLLLGVGLTVLVLAFKRPLLYLFGASGVTFPYADDYLTVYALGTVFVMVGLGMNPFINSQGFARIGMLTVALGAAVNLVLDPIFIFVLDMGVKGAALATVISQACSALWVLQFLTGRKTLLRLGWANLRLKGGRVRQILSLGTSGFVMALTNSLAQIICNATLQIKGAAEGVGLLLVNELLENVQKAVDGVGGLAVPGGEHVNAVKGAVDDGVSVDDHELFHRWPPVSWVISGTLLYHNYIRKKASHPKGGAPGRRGGGRGSPSPPPLI